MESEKAADASGADADTSSFHLKVEVML